MEWWGSISFQHIQGKAFKSFLRRPNFNKVFILHTNWSVFVIGVILGQLDEEGKEYVIAYASRSNNKVESNYSSYEGECLVVIWAVIHFKPYLYATNFTLYTDHQPIKWLMTNDKLIGKLARWALILQEYEFKVIHRPGITHQNMDTMSQRPLTTSEDFLEAGKTLSRFQQYMYLMHLVILHYYNVTWLSIPLWIYGRTWTLWGFFNMGNTLPKLHQVIGIAYNSGLNVTHGGTIISFDAYHKAIEWFLHHMNDLVLFKRYIRSLDILELSVLITFSLLITIREVCMFKFETSLLGVNNVIGWELLSLLDSSCFLHSLFRACSIAGHVI